MILDQICGSFDIDQAPAVFIIGSRISSVVSSVDEQTLECARAHGLARE